MSQVIWVLVNCNSIKEAQSIGRVALKKRLSSCFDIFSRYSTSYFWPPKTKKIETSKRAVLLVLESFEEKYKSIVKEVKKLHTDELPFIGFIEIKGVSKDYINWMREELK